MTTKNDLILLFINTNINILILIALLVHSILRFIQVFTLMHLIPRLLKIITEYH